MPLRHRDEGLRPPCGLDLAQVQPVLQAVIPMICLYPSGGCTSVRSGTRSSSSYGSSKGRSTSWSSIGRIAERTGAGIGSSRCDAVAPGLLRHANQPVPASPGRQDCSEGSARQDLGSCRAATRAADAPRRSSRCLYSGCSLAGSCPKAATCVPSSVAVQLPSTSSAD